MTTRITDLSYLNSISEGDEEFKKDMIQTFLDTAPVYLTEMKRSLTAMDWKKIGDIAHSMKPSFTMLGMNEQKGTVLKIEEDGRNQTNTENLPALIDELGSIISQASAELRKELETAP